MTKQEDKRYCTICGRRIGAHIQNIQTFQDGTASYEITRKHSRTAMPPTVSRTTPLASLSLPALGMIIHRLLGKSRKPSMTPLVMTR